VDLADGGQRFDMSASTRAFSDFGPRVFGGDGNDIITGSSRRDALIGGNGKDALVGNAGDDQLAGGGNKDVLNGGNNNDILAGDAGADSLTGGNGNDAFDFNLIADSGKTATTRDVIADFTVDASSGAAFIDRLDFSTIDAKAGTVINDAFSFIGGAAFSAEGQIRAIQQGANTLVQVNTAGNGGADMVVLLANFTVGNLTDADIVF